MPLTARRWGGWYRESPGYAEDMNVDCCVTNFSGQVGLTFDTGPESPKNYLGNMREDGFRGWQILACNAQTVPTFVTENLVCPGWPKLSNHVYDVSAKGYPEAWAVHMIEAVYMANAKFGANVTGVFIDSIVSRWWWPDFKPLGFDVEEYTTNVQNFLNYVVARLHYQGLEVWANVAWLTDFDVEALDVVFLEHVTAEQIEYDSYGYRTFIERETRPRVCIMPAKGEVIPGLEDLLNAKDVISQT